MGSREICKLNSSSGGLSGYDTAVGIYSISTSYQAINIGFVPDVLILTTHNGSSIVTTCYNADVNSSKIYVGSSNGGYSTANLHDTTKDFYFSSDMTTFYRKHTTATSTPGYWVALKQK